MHSMCTVANAREDAVRRRHPTVAWTVEKERCLESREAYNDKPRECVLGLGRKMCLWGLCCECTQGRSHYAYCVHREKKSYHIFCTAPHEKLSTLGIPVARFSDGALNGV